MRKASIIRKAKTARCVRSGATVTDGVARSSVESTVEISQVINRLPSFEAERRVLKGAAVWSDMAASPQCGKRREQSICYCSRRDAGKRHRGRFFHSERNVNLPRFDLNLSPRVASPPLFVILFS